MAQTPAERPDSPLARLVPDGGEVDAAIQIHSPVVGIGQGAQSDVKIDDDTVSSQHARLEYDTGGWRITDLESRNGTYLEGVRLAPGIPTPIAEGALLALGAVKFQFMTSDAVDLEKARAEYSAVPEKVPLAERSALRLPLWLLLLVLLVVAALIALFFWFGGEPAATGPAVEATTAIVLPAATTPPA
ncbi:MAG: FHA domain-containing protein [Gemmatimonadota bacterium]